MPGPRCPEFSADVYRMRPKDAAQKWGVDPSVITYWRKRFGLPKLTGGNCGPPRASHPRVTGVRFTPEVGRLTAAAIDYTEETEAARRRYLRDQSRDGNLFARAILQRTYRMRHWAAAGF